MYMKRYTIAALIFMTLVGGYVYAYITQNTMSIEFFGVLSPQLSIAVWVTLPLLILYIATLFHISFHSFLGSLKLRKYEKDFQNIVDAIADAYLGKTDKHYIFKTERYKLIGGLIENTKLLPMSNLEEKTSSEKLNTVLLLIKKIRDGEVVDLKKQNLQINNELAIQNERNRYKKGEITSEEILSNSVKYADILCKEVYVDFVEKAPLNTIEKYKSFLTKEALYKILARVNADSFTLEIPNETILSFLEKLDLKKEDYIKLSSVLSEGGMIPEQRIKLFEMLSDENEDIIDAYLFTLFDLEMLAPANAILDNSQANEYQNFKAYRALKENNQNFNISLFVQST
jgi:hypothetical protein